MGMQGEAQLQAPARVERRLTPNPRLQMFEARLAAARVGMAEKSDAIDKHFGVVIAFWLPGFILLWGLTYSFPELSKLLPNSTETETPTVGGFLYATLASLAIGLMVSALRWMLVDTLLYRLTRVKKPNIDFAKLKDGNAYSAFQGVVENHYRYYQYYSNALVSVVVAFVAFWFVHGIRQVSLLMWTALVVACASLLLASRDCLVKYCTRAEQVASQATGESK
jgi:hypothetical protein